MSPDRDSKRAHSGSRVSRAMHGCRFATPVANQAEADAVVTNCRKRKANRVVVGGDMAFAEYPAKVDYTHGAVSASKHLKREVIALDVMFSEVANVVSQRNVPSALYGYNRDEMGVEFDPRTQRQNKSALAVLRASSAMEMVERGLIAPTQFARIAKAQSDLGILIDNDGGARTRLRPGHVIRMTFIVNGAKRCCKISIPDNSDDVDTTSKDVDRATTLLSNGNLCTDVAGLPAVDAMISNSTKRCHYWFWSRVPNTGKTTNMRGISKFAFTMTTRYQNGFFDKVDRQAQINFLDEYGNGSPAEVVTRRLAMSDINLMCDGEYGFNQKGRNPVELLDKHPLIVIFSNKPPEEVYTVKRGGEHVPCVEDLSLLHARFNVVRIDGDNPGEEDDVVNVVDAVDTVTTLTERDNGEDGGLDGVVVDSATDACGSTLTVDSAGPSDASVCAVP